MESRSSEIPYPLLLQLEFDKFKGILRTLAIRIYFADFDSSFVETRAVLGQAFLTSTTAQSLMISPSILCSCLCAICSSALISSSLCEQPSLASLLPRGFSRNSNKSIFLNIPAPFCSKIAKRGYVLCCQRFLSFHHRRVQQFSLVSFILKILRFYILQMSVFKEVLFVGAIGESLLKLFCWDTQSKRKIIFFVH